MSNAHPTDPPWPTARLDPIARLRVLATGLPGVAMEEGVFDATFEEVWSLLTDFERSVPAFDEDVAGLRIVSRRGDPARGEDLRIVTRQTARVLWFPWIPAAFDIDLSNGWCWMVSRPQGYVIGMAAHPEGDRTRIGHLEGVVLGAPRPLGPLVRPILALSRWRHRRHLPRDIAGMQRLISAEIPC